MKRSELNLVVQVGKHVKERLAREAEERGIESGALVRAILQQHVAEVGDEFLGWVEDGSAHVQLQRAPYVELVVPVRQLSRRSPGRL